jgi:hypothetical protein
MVMTSGLALALLFNETKRPKHKSLIGRCRSHNGYRHCVYKLARRCTRVHLGTCVCIRCLTFSLGRWSDEKSLKESGNEPQRRIGPGRSGRFTGPGHTWLCPFAGCNESLFRGIGVTQIQDGVSNGRAHSGRSLSRSFWNTRY